MAAARIGNPGSKRGAAVLALACSTACGHSVLTPQLHAPDSPPRARADSPVLKVHMKSGELYRLTNWTTAPDGDRVEGTGTRYSLARVAGETGRFTIAATDVALFETNRHEKAGRFGTGVLVVMSTVAGAVAAICVADPKGCFGSCPTFYLDGADPDGRPAAEGFSASIARALEARDVDAIGAGPAAGGRFVLTMRNEALETHAVRRVRLLVAERPAGGRVLADPAGLFHTAIGFMPPVACHAREGSCLSAVASLDGDERSSPADAQDLAARETLELDFAPASGRVGLVLEGRQTLLSTHVFYQTLAYFGSRAGEYLASLERGGPALAGRAMGMARVLGGVEAFVSESDGPWRAVGSFDEPGPIAGDTQVLPFRANGGPLRVRLRQARGHWRLDRVALVRLGDALVPRVLEPVAVERDALADARALERLRRGERHLVTSPGDAYRIAFELPASRHGLELFLESEGYYYEWMREAWLAEEDAGMAALVLSDPADALKRMALPFKQREAGMESAFWASRFRR